MSSVEGFLGVLAWGLSAERALGPSSPLQPEFLILPLSAVCIRLLGVIALVENLHVSA